MSVVPNPLVEDVLDRVRPSRRSASYRATGDVRPWQFESWSAIGHRPVGTTVSAADFPTPEMLRRYLRDKPWVAPAQPICFITDLHADREAFWRSLLDAGIVELGGDLPVDGIAAVPDTDFELTDFGARTHCIIGGDLFDKGPANLPLLDAITVFRRSGVRFTLLAGNHDVRTFLGIRFARSEDPRLAHLFVRMGKKTLTLFKEVFDAHLAGGDSGNRLSDAEVRRRLFPGEEWFREFPNAAAGLVPAARIEKELNRVREKMSELEARCRELEMTLGDVHAALDHCQDLFLSPKGEYAWVFDEMEIACREGSLLFCHAGVDDRTASWIQSRGLDFVRREFRRSLELEPFELYNGPLGNMFRTKYRDLDLPLSDRGCRAMHQAGIYAIVHGHRNVYLGQHMNFRRGMLNFACDSCVDRNTRRIEGLGGEGSAATIISADGTIYGLSTDHPGIKVFDPAYHDGWVTIV